MVESFRNYELSNTILFSKHTLKMFIHEFQNSSLVNETDNPQESLKETTRYI